MSTLIFKTDKQLRIKNPQFSRKSSKSLSTASFHPRIENSWSSRSLNKNAFINIYKKLSLPLTKFISKRIGRDQEAVEEVFSRTVHAAFKGFSTFKNKSSYFTWLCRIALNKIADYYRDQVDENSVLVTPALKDLAEIGSKEPSHEEKMALNELCASVRDCLNLLPYEKRRLLWFRYWKDLSLKEISKKLGVSERAVEGQIFRAKKKLKEILEIKHPEISPSYKDIK